MLKIQKSKLKIISNEPDNELVGSVSVREPRSLFSGILILLLGFGIWSLGFTSEASIYPLTIKDDSGQKITIKSEPKRIISTMPSNTEILAALGLNDKIVGITTKCNYPPSITAKEKVGSTIINIEKVVSLKPDLIVMSGDAQKSDVAKLRGLNMQVLVVNPHSVKDILSSIKLIGKVTNKERASQKLARNLSGRLKGIEWRPYKKKPSVFIEIWHNPLITSGKGTYLNDGLSFIGLNNIAGGINISYPEYSIEKLLVDNPDYIVVAGDDYTRVTQIISDQNWQKLNAVKTSRIILINSDILLRPGPRFVSALEKIVKSVYEKK